MTETMGPTVLSDSADSCRFLAQATFGADRATIDNLAGQNYGAWIDDQRNKPISRTKPYMDQILAQELAATDPQQDQFGFRLVKDGVEQAWAWNFSTPWMQNIVHGDDPLRQRITWCLSQILVVSYRQGLTHAGNSIAEYYDLLAEHAFGNYRDLLKAVTLNPSMSFYLSSLGNQKADPSSNRYPDENYAREVMQLFTIGLWELNPDGTRQRDGAGEPIPTYDNEDVSELAKVFTGLWFDGKPFGINEGDKLTNLRDLPLSMFEDDHEVGPKTIFHDKPWETTLPAGQPGMIDIDQAIDLLIDHPNTPPFISRQLIQFLIKSHPSADYVQRISAVFADNGSGVRGDLHAVVKAILLDTEARTYDPTDSRAGKLIEPMVRITRLIKAFGGGKDEPNLIWWWWENQAINLGQWPLASPTVFNFFEPDYTDYQSPLGQASPPVNSPEFMIMTPITIPDLANYFHYAITRRIHDLGEHESMGHAPDFVLDFSPLMPLADDSDALIDYVDDLLCFGELQPQTRAIVKMAVDDVNSDSDDNRLRRIHAAIYMVVVSADSAVLK